MAKQRMDVNSGKQNADMNQNVDMNVNRAGNNKQSPNVTGAGETSRTANDDIGNPNTGRARDTGRADTDMDADTMGGDLSSDH